MLSSDSHIIIVGAGVFGLSTALWLARSGYKNITVFDRCAFDKNNYNPSEGCDGASADISKVFRTAYETRKDYQALAFEARNIWLAWDQSIKGSSASDLPRSLTRGDKLLDICGVYFMADGSKLKQSYAESLDTMEKFSDGFRELQFIKGSAHDEQRLSKTHPKWIKKYLALDKMNDGNTNGFLDIGAGITLADKACTYARFLCVQAGVKFVLGEPQGKMQSLEVDRDGLEQMVTGIKTCDGLSHSSDLVIIACGSWSASIIPEAHRSIEATAGTVVFIDIPKGRHDLWEKFHPDNFPVWAYKGGVNDEYFIYGFPITNEGRLKFGFRGRKFTNFQDHPSEPNLRISTPQTKYSHHPINTVPLYSLNIIKEGIVQAFPELAEIGFTDSRLCWYTDSIDNDFVIDYVPGYSDSLFMCSGGSGHGFKFLPILGKYVKNQLERVPDQFTQVWKWRVAEEGKECNGLEQGETGPREMAKLQMADREFPAPDVYLQLISVPSSSRLQISEEITAQTLSK